ncbi:het domain protein [Teratosphaeria destructans]|uniref:Het domain protein n=1 Tax=Teratosphaeria destructans TaxID=418781 RepID=A0A9W7SLM4_9PEZI|nr:het domain protein [Teratosphaeria destructans]
MWLLRTDGSYKLEHFHKPPLADLLDSLSGREKYDGYAVLSHTWGDEEISFSEIHNIEAAKTKRGFKKVELTCRQANADGLEHAWIDTCCIDKTSSAELSEAINSMFDWYKRSAVCYVYLSDFSLSGRKLASWGKYIADSAELHEETWAKDNPVLETHHIRKVYDMDVMESRSEYFRLDADLEVEGNSGSSSLNESPSVKDLVSRLGESRWFYRCWTLQELIAPNHVAFFDESWTFFGERSMLANVFAAFMVVPRAVLVRSASSLRRALDTFNIAAKFSWAYNRHSTRVEDAAYSLLGLFDVNMPLLYGEGSKALVRLQEAIMRSNCDDSILLWREVIPHEPLLADELTYWTGANRIVSLPFRSDFACESTGNSLRVTVTVTTLPDGSTWIITNSRYRDDLSGQIGVEVVFLDPSEQRSGRGLMEPAATLKRPCLLPSRDEPTGESFRTFGPREVASATLRTLLLVPHPDTNAWYHSYERFGLSILLQPSESFSHYFPNGPCGVHPEGRWNAQTGVMQWDDLNSDHTVDASFIWRAPQGLESKWIACIIRIVTYPSSSYVAYWLTSLSQDSHIGVTDIRNVLQRAKEFQQAHSEYDRSPICPSGWANLQGFTTEAYTERVDLQDSVRERTPPGKESLHFSPPASYTLSVGEGRCLQFCMEEKEIMGAVVCVLTPKIVQRVRRPPHGDGDWSADTEMRGSVQEVC